MSINNWAQKSNIRKLKGLVLSNHRFVTQASEALVRSTRLVFSHLKLQNNQDLKDKYLSWGQNEITQEKVSHNDGIYWIEEMFISKSIQKKFKLLW